MANAKLIISLPAQAERELELSGNVSIGSAADNTLCLAHPQVSRWHALIEKRTDGFWVSDLGSATGTLVNGQPLTGGRQLQNGDVISLGPESRLKFFVGNGQSRAFSPESPSVATPPAPPVEVKTEPQAAPPPTFKAPATSSGGLTGTQVAMAVGIGVGVLLILVPLGMWVLSKFSSDCRKARIVSPSSDTLINSPTAVTVKADYSTCIQRVVFYLDGQEFESAAAQPYVAMLDLAKVKARFPGLADGAHDLTIAVEDEKGALKTQPQTVSVKLEFPKAPPPQSGDLVRSLAQGLVSQITGGSGSALIFEPEFLAEINRRTADYRQDVVTSGRKYSSEIRREFGPNHGVPIALGFILALSRSRLSEDSAVSGCGVAPGGIGLWRLPPEAVELRHNSSPAAAAAASLNELMGSFSGPSAFVYAVACFGEPLARAGEIDELLFHLPNREDQTNFWKTAHAIGLKPEEIERVVCFFAAGIVGENPQYFQVNAPPLSSLY